MANPTASADLTGLYKEAYPEGIVNLIPKSSIVQRNVKFRSGAEKVGNKYHIPLVLSPEQGVTYGIKTLVGPQSMEMGDAQLQGSSVTIQGALDYDAAARSVGKNSFDEATSLQMNVMIEQGSKRIEVATLYGQSPTGLGLIASTGTTTTTTTTLVLSEVQWSGIWSGSKKALLDVVAVTGGAVANSVGPLTVSTVNFSTFSIVVSGASADITAVNAAVVASGGAIIRYSGATDSSGNQFEMAGLDRIMTNTGVLFNVDAATNELWKTTQVTVGTPLSFDIVGEGVAIAQQAGGLDEEATLLISPTRWRKLNSDLAANRRYDSSYKKADGELGNQGITYWAETGEIQVLPHPFVKNGDGFLVPFKRVRRVGAQEISFNTPAMGSEGTIFLQSQTFPGYEYRLYGNEALIIDSPAKCVKFNNVTLT